MSDPVKIYLPNPDYAKEKGWKYHVQWFDDGRPCFFRRQTLEEARRDFNGLTADGFSPFVVDALTGETVNVG